MDLIVASHIRLEGACNARDLGGYAASEGTTARYAFIRCESPAHLSETDRALLITLGVRGVIDLRGEAELRREPNPFADTDGVAFYNIPLFAAHPSPHLMEKATMGDLYVHMLDASQPGFAAVFRAVLDIPGAVLFHCSAGKDRTGLVAALLLLLAGVDRDTVIAEYAYTQTLLAPWVARQLALAQEHGSTLNPRMLEADPAYLTQALDHLAAVYGGAADYLQAIGLTEEETAALARRVLRGWED